MIDDNCIHVLLERRGCQRGVVMARHGWIDCDGWESMTFTPPQTLDAAEILTGCELRANGGNEWSSRFRKIDA